MKKITIKSALMRLVAVVLLTLGTISVSAQYYMNVVQKDGVKVQYLVSDIDSVYFSDQQSPTADYEYVDLGLSVLWATCNVGASKPEEYGDYYAWGETETKSSYAFTNYKFRTSGDSWDNVKFSKYNTSSSYGTVDNKTVLDPEDDVAHVKWGGSWRLPTKEEQDDLRNKCTWTWYSSGNTEFNGVAGYKVTSNVSGYTDRFIFLPAAGYRYDTSLADACTYGGYWSSSLYSDYPYDAHRISFQSGPISFFDGLRDYGRSVRPVCPSEEWLNAVSITLNSNLDSIVMGNTITLSDTVKHGDEIIDREVTWTSDNPSIASVSKTGIVTAIAVGSTTITAICMGKTATCTITVIEPQYENRYEYVDLGLSVKWATCNVGATTPEGTGDYFAWGDTATYYEPGYAQEHPQTHWKEGKTGYSWSSYKYCNGSGNSLTKYCSKSGIGYGGYTDSDTTLLYVDDVAHYKWGGDWRMPTRTEINELCNSDNCTWTWTTQNGVNGYLVTSKKSGHEGASIFLPAAGYRRDTDLYGVGSGGYYWSSSLYTDYSLSAWDLYFYSDDLSTYYDSRRHGQSVRPVCP